MHKCEICNVDFINPDDELLQCERCFKWNCTCCLKMSTPMYQMMSSRQDMHWFCPVCERPAMSAVYADKEIEAYLQNITGKIDKKQVEIGNKAEKVEVEAVKADMVTVSNRVNNVNSDVSKLETRIELLYQEPERKKMWLQDLFWRRGSSQILI